MILILNASVSKLIKKLSNRSGSNSKNKHRVKYLSGNFKAYSLDKRWEQAADLNPKPVVVCLIKNKPNSDKWKSKPTIESNVNSVAANSTKMLHKGTSLSVSKSRRKTQ